MSEEKKSFLEKISAQILDWDSQINELKQKSAEVKGEVKKSLEDKLVEINKQKEQVKIRVNEISQVSDEAWKTAKEGLDKASQELTNSFNSIIESLKKSKN